MDHFCNGLYKSAIEDAEDRKNICSPLWSPLKSKQIRLSCFSHLLFSPLFSLFSLLFFLSSFLFFPLWKRGIHVGREGEGSLTGQATFQASLSDPFFLSLVDGSLYTSSHLFMNYHDAQHTRSLILFRLRST